MKNLWIHTDDPVVTWMGDFTSIATQPETVLRFIQETLVAGVRHRIFDVAEAPVVAYLRDRDGALGDVLARLLERDRVLDLFAFTGAAMLPGHPKSSAVETTLCHYDRGDRIVESAVTDQGALLAGLEPVPNCIPNGCMTHYPAVRITGRRYTDVREGLPIDRSAHPLPLAFRLCLHSDIWFPWVFGFAHPEADQIRMFDNRELANCHTPRLNAFLGEVAKAARGAGGTFKFRPDESATPAANWVDDQSVHLDWMPPDGSIMPPEMVNVEWTPL